MIDWSPRRPSAAELERRSQIARARGIRAAAPNQRAIEGPVPPTDPYDYADPLANRTPGASNVTAFGQLGFSNLWIAERENLLNNARIQDAPFVVGTVLAGLNYPLSDADVAALNEHFGVTP